MTKPFLDTIAARVAHVHALSGLDRAALSTVAGLGRSHIGMLMRGIVKDPAASSMRQLAETTGTTTDWLISGTGDEPGEEQVRAAVAQACLRKATGGRRRTRKAA